MALNALKFIPTRLLQGPVYDTVMALSRWLNLKLYAVDQSRFPAVPAVDSGVTFAMQIGSTNVTTNASGIGRVNFPKSFPNDCLSVLCQWQTGFGSLTSATIHVSFQTKTYFEFGTTWANTPMAVNWIAVGW